MKNMKQARQQGFTLIELMIVIAIVGILSAVALPAYQDYTERAKLSEALAIAGEAKTSIAEYVAIQGSLPADTNAAGLSDNPSGMMVSAQSVTNGVLTLTLSGTSSDASYFGESIVFTPTRSGNSIDSWACTVSDADKVAKYMPANCRSVTPE